MSYHPALVILGWAMAVPATAQIPKAVSSSYFSNDQDDQQPIQQQSQTPLNTNQAGRIEESSVGQIGERRTRDQIKGIHPMARIANRVQNRVQNRISNRIDRDYDPQNNVADPFTVAEDQARTAGRQR